MYLFLTLFSFCLLTHSSFIDFAKEEEGTYELLYGEQKLKIIEDYSSAFERHSILCVGCRHQEFVPRSELQAGDTGQIQYSRLLQLAQTGIIGSVDDDFSMVNIDVVEGFCHIMMDVFKLENWKLLVVQQQQIKFDKIVVTIGYFLPGMPIFDEMKKLLKYKGTIHHIYLLDALTEGVIPSFYGEKKRLTRPKTDISSNTLKSSNLIGKSILPSYKWLKKANSKEIKAKKRKFAKYHEFKDLHIQFCQLEGYFLFLKYIKKCYFTKRSCNDRFPLMKMNISFRTFERILASKYLSWLSKTYPEYEYSFHTTRKGISASEVNIVFVNSQVSSFIQIQTIFALSITIKQ